MMHHFCTSFDHHFLDRGLALYASLKRHCRQFHLWVLCLDEPCFRILCKMHLSSVGLISMSRFEGDDEDLLKAKQDRNRIEYYFTCTPSLPLFILKRQREIETITYLDADLFFYKGIEPIYREMGDRSIGIIEHRYPPKLRYREKYGIYNVGLLIFRRDENSLACLKWWRERCIEWCRTRVEHGRFADQKYLDHWPEQFQNVMVLEHKGLNLATWNLANYRVHETQQGVMVDDQPLIFFHFQGFRQLNPWLYDPNALDFRVFLTGKTKRLIFHPYIRELEHAGQMLAPYTKRKILPKGIRGDLKHRSAVKRLRSILVQCLTLMMATVTGNYVFMKKRPWVHPVKKRPRI